MVQHGCEKWLLYCFCTLKIVASLVFFFLEKHFWTDGLNIMKRNHLCRCFLWYCVCVYIKSPVVYKYSGTIMKNNKIFCLHLLEIILNLKLKFATCTKKHIDTWFLVSNGVFRYNFSNMWMTSKLLIPHCKSLYTTSTTVVSNSWKAECTCSETLLVQFSED